MAYVSRIGLFNVLRTVFLTSCKRFKIVVNGHIFCKTSERAQHNVPFWTSLIWKPCLSHRCCFSLYIMCCVYLSWDWYNGHTKSSAPLSNLVQNCILVCQTVCNTNIKMNNRIKPSCFSVAMRSSQSDCNLSSYIYIM